MKQSVCFIGRLHRRLYRSHRNDVIWNGT